MKNPRSHLSRSAADSRHYLPEQAARNGLRPVPSPRGNGPARSPAAPSGSRSSVDSRVDNPTLGIDPAGPLSALDIVKGGFHPENEPVKLAPVRHKGPLHGDEGADLYWSRCLPRSRWDHLLALVESIEAGSGHIGRPLLVAWDVLSIPDQTLE